MIRRLSFVLGLILYAAALAWPCSAQVHVRLPGVQYTDQENRPTPEAELANDVLKKKQLPNAQIQRDAGPPYENMFYTVGMGGRTEPKMGGFRASLPDLFRVGFNYDTPFFKSQGAATNAEIRVGRLYYDVTSLSTSWLYSDNVDLTESNRRSGVIGIFTLKGVAMIQLMENLRISVKAGLVFLPLRGKFGLAGFVNDSASGRLFFGDSELLRAQVSYDLQLARWNLVFYDQVRATQALFAERFNVAAGEPFDEQDRAGRYVFRSTIGGGGNNLRVNESDQRNSLAFIYANNQLGASANRLIPTDTRIEFGAYRMNYWYLGATDGLLPYNRDVGYASLTSERDNLRFKPFASYQIYRSNEQEWDQEMRGGFQGPVTENLKFNGSVGYFIGGKTDKRRMLAHASLRHQLGPLTSQSIVYRRDVTAPEQDLEESYSYHLRQILGPYLNADAFFTYATFEDLNNNNTGTTEWRGGLLLNSDFSAKTVFRVGGVYARVEYNNPLLGEWDRWSAIAQLRHHFSESWEAVLTYQYQNRASTVVGDSYYENLVMLTVTKYFDAPQRHVDTTEQ